MVTANESGYLLRGSIDEEWLLRGLSSRCNAHAWVHHAGGFTPHEHCSNAELGGKWWPHCQHSGYTSTGVPGPSPPGRAAHDI